MIIIYQLGLPYFCGLFESWYVIDNVYRAI